MQRSTVVAAVAISLLFSFAEGLVAGNAPPAYGDQDAMQGVRQNAKNAAQGLKTIAYPDTHKGTDKVDAQKPEKKTAPS